MPAKKAKKTSKKAVQRTSAKSVKYSYDFGKKTDGSAKLRELLGGKGANLAEMTSIGLPVPPGFTITTQTCADYNDGGMKFPAGLMDEVKKNVALLFLPNSHRT